MSRMTISMTDSLYQYYLTHSLREDPILAQLRLETKGLSAAKMQIAPEQGQFLAFLVKMLNAKKTLDIGVFTGYSALVVAMAMTDEGKVIGCDINNEWTNMAKKYWQLAEQAQKIELKLGQATETLKELLHQGEASSFDFIFIDADKKNYPTYYELSLQLLRSGGVIAIDNVFQDGRVITPTDENACVIDALNEKILQDVRVDLSMLPIADGLTLARKR